MAMKIMENPAKCGNIAIDVHCLKDVLRHARNVPHLMELQQLMHEFDGQDGDLVWKKSREISFSHSPVVEKIDWVDTEDVATIGFQDGPSLDQFLSTTSSCMPCYQGPSMNNESLLQRLSVRRMV